LVATYGGFPSSRTGHKSKTKTHIKEPKGAMDKVAEAAGVPFSAHDLRRMFSNLLSSASEVGAEQAFVKMAMNHAAADDVTATHYLDKVEQRSRLRQSSPAPSAHSLRMDESEFTVDTRRLEAIAALTRFPARSSA
jgi:integrase